MSAIIEAIMHMRVERFCVDLSVSKEIIIL